MAVRGRSRTVPLIAAAASAINAQAKASLFERRGGEQQAAAETPGGKACSRGADRWQGWTAAATLFSPALAGITPVRVMTTLSRR